MAQDPVADYLRSVQTSDRVRAAAWDAVYQAKDDADAQQRLRQLPISDNTRADLWDFRHGKIVPPAKPFSAEMFTDQSQPQGSATSRFLSNAGQYLNPINIVGGLYQTVAHPLDTMRAGYQQAQDQIAKAESAPTRSEAAGHYMAAAIPFVGPAAANAGEQIGRGDVAGGLGSATGLLAPAAVPLVARGASAMVSRAGAVAPRAAEVAADALESGAARRVTDVLAPKVGANKIRFGNQAAKVAPALAQDLATDGAPWSRAGLASQIDSKLSEAEAGLDAASDARNAGKAYDTQPILDSLEQKRNALVAGAVEGSRPTPNVTNLNKYGEETVLSKKEAVPIGSDVTPAPNAARVDAIDQVINEVKQLGPVARYESLRRIRQAWDQVAKVKYAPSMTADFLKKAGEASGAADATGVLRDYLAQQDPQTAAANATYSLYKTAKDVAQAAEETERTRPRVGRAIMARLTASLIGEKAAGVPGAVAGYLGGPLIDSAVNAGATTQLQTAALMQRLANAVRGGDVSAVDGALGRMRALLDTKQNRALGLARRGVVVNQATSPNGSPSGLAPVGSAQ